MSSTDNSDTESIQSSQNDVPPEVKLIIHHQFPGVELVSPVYTCDGATCHLTPDQRVYFGSTTQAGFKNDSGHGSLNILMYKLQRKNMDESNEEVISSKDEATCIQLVIIFEVDGFEEFCMYSRLIEHDKDSVWDRDRLIELADRCVLSDIQHISVEETYLMHDNVVLMTRANVTCEETYYKLEMTITEGSVNEDTRKPWYVNMDR
jgi:hypothetical protein